VDWRHEAACRDEDPELFFPIGNTGPAILQIEEAKAVCRRCKVIEPCLKWALETGQDSGVWGGTSEDERRAIKRRAQRARARGLEPTPHVFETDLPNPEPLTEADSTWATVEVCQTCVRIWSRM
jgi:WhiB family redox-sensing transcriptional regulator